MEFKKRNCIHGMGVDSRETCHDCDLDKMAKQYESEKKELQSKIATLTCALAEASTLLEDVWDSNHFDYHDGGSKQQCEEGHYYVALPLLVNKKIEEYLLANKDGQRASEEMKGLEERVRDMEEGFDEQVEEITRLTSELEKVRAENERLKNLTHFGYSEVPELKSRVDTLTLALAEARERIKQLEDSLDVALKSGEVYKKEATNFAEKERDASNLLGIFKKSQIDFEKKIQDLNSLVSFMHSLIKFIHNDGKGREVFPNCELFSALEDLLNDPTSIRASEEMKALRKVVEAAKFVPRNIVSTDPISIRVVANLKEALEAYESRGKV